MNGWGWALLATGTVVLLKGEEKTTNTLLFLVFAVLLLIWDKVPGKAAA